MKKFKNHWFIKFGFDKKKSYFYTFKFRLHQYFKKLVLYILFERIEGLKRSRG